jgi:hypothetical protein
MENDSDKNCRENQNTYFMLNNVFGKKNLAVCEIMREKHGKTGQATDYNIIRRMRFACWITKVTDSLRIRNTYPRQQWLRESRSLLRHM